MHRGARDTGVCQRRGWPGEQLLLQKMLDTCNSPTLCTERKKSLSAARSDSRRRKKVDLKSKLHIRTKVLYLPPPLLSRKSIRIESQLIFWETNVK